MTSKIRNSHFFAQVTIRTCKSACKPCHIWLHTLKNCAFLSVSFCAIFVPEFAHFAYLFRTTQTRAVTGFIAIFSGAFFVVCVPDLRTCRTHTVTDFPTIRPSDHPTILNIGQIFLHTTLTPVSYWFPLEAFG
ncbi:hypothetical protein EOI87_27190 [Salmonella enterica]|nr:hypothetical protein [Salmonella enterica]EBT1275347.1 hypothetical protein [Salmonella enterica]MIV19534.1 hypothetical protein [Salmonella enterica]